jgi:hypothetical protein
MGRENQPHWGVAYRWYAKPCVFDNGAGLILDSSFAKRNAPAGAVEHWGKQPQVLECNVTKYNR